MAIVVPRALLFDWDNTLVNNWPTLAAVLNATLREYGVLQPAEPDWTIAQVQENGRHTLKESFALLFGDQAPVAADFFYQRFAEIHLEALRPMPGSGALVTALRGLDIPLAIVSNKRTTILQREVMASGWADSFAVVVGAGDTPRGKPDPAPILLACDRLGVSPGHDVWMIGDTDVDIIAGQAAGCGTVFINQLDWLAYRAQRPGLEMPPPDLIFPDCAALHQALVEIKQIKTVA